VRLEEIPVGDSWKKFLESLPKAGFQDELTKFRPYSEIREFKIQSPGTVSNFWSETTRHLMN
jgi:hypothetical protein